MHARLSRQPTRRIVAMMLFVWLFAVAASWANACILQPEGSGEHPVRNGLTVLHDPGHAHDAGAGEPHESDPALQACVNFCDTGQSIVAKAQPAKGDSSADPSALFVQVVATWPAFTPGEAEVRWHPPAAPPPPGPPVAIAFLRLTL
jgi:hypothetical protein